MQRPRLDTSPDVQRGVPVSGRGAVSFTKMHSLGNDFVVVDSRDGSTPMSSAEAIALLDRHRGVGGDQLLSLLPSGRADIAVRIHNVDGREAGMCGNALRCIGAVAMRETGQSEVTIEVAGAQVSLRRDASGGISVNLGAPLRQWQSIPLARPCNTRALPLASLPPGDGPALAAPAAVGFGNPHAVFIIEDFDALPLASLGSRFEHDALFPEGANVTFARVDAADRLRLKTWERSAGFTKACSSGAAAALVVAHERGLTGASVTAVVDGGELAVVMDDAGEIWASGPVAMAFSGIVDPEVWNQA